MADKSRKMEIVVKSSPVAGAFTGKKVFVTGHTGFKGSWLSAMLHLMGAEVYGYALAPEHEGGLYDFLPASTFNGEEIADIRNSKRLMQKMLEFNPDFIFHLAAQPLVLRSYREPAYTFEVNVMGTVHVLEALRGLSKDCTCIVITTDKVYQNQERNYYYAEGDTLGGYDPYSASKASAELVAGAYGNAYLGEKHAQEYRKILATARAGNVIGGGDWSEFRILPDIIRSIERGEELNVRNPNAVRPWQHVLEPVWGYLCLAAYMQKSGQPQTTAFNFGPEADDHLTVKELVESAIASYGSGKWTSGAADPGMHEAGLLQLNVDKARMVLGWQPRLRAQQAVQWSVEWYKQPASEKWQFTRQQILKYLS